MAGSPAVNPSRVVRSDYPDASYVPDFLRKLGVAKGEFLTTTKNQVSALMRPDYPLDVRIWACLVTQAHGYRGDLAVLMKRNRLKGDLTLKVPLSPWAIMTILNRAATAAYDETGTPKDQRRPPVSRQNVRRMLAQMEDDGLLDRLRANCEPHKLIGFSLSEALQKGLVTPLRELSHAARKKIPNGATCVYLPAKPRAAKAYNAVLKEASLEGAEPVQLQLFDFFPELKSDPGLAEGLTKRADVQQILARYTRECSEAQHLEERAKQRQEQAKQRCIRALKPIVQPAAGSETAPDQAELFPPDFHAGLCDRFRAAGKPVPTLKQSNAIATKLAGREADFLSTLTVHKLRRVQHPGVLPSLVDEFLGAPTPKPKAEESKPWVPACSHCKDSGLVGVQWNLIPEAIAAVENGAQYCTCKEGAMVRDLVEPERLRKAAGVGRAS